jgi:hypothetical protein
MVRWSVGLHSLDVVWVKWLLMENFPDKVNIGILSNRNSSHTGSGIFFHSSQFVNFSKTPQQTLICGHVLTGTFLFIYMCTTRP